MDNMSRYGFRWVGSNGGTVHPKPRLVRVATGYSGSEGAVTIDLNIGDPVMALATGYVAHCDVGSPVYGVICGVQQYWDGTKLVVGTKVPAGQGAYSTNLDRMTFVSIIPAQDQMFEVDVDDIVTATTEAGYIALIGENCDLSWNGVSATAKGWPKLDISDHKASTAQWRIIDISKTRDNFDPAGANYKLIVTANEVFDAPNYTAGV